MGAVEQLKEVRARIAEAEQEAGRDAGSVELIAVSKTFDADAIRPVLEAGQRVFGENRVQEAQGKWPGLKGDFAGVEMHLIGPLQSNKTKEAVTLFDVIQTVDREKIARAIAKEMQKQGKTVRLYVEINTGMEPQKAGIAPDDCPSFLKMCREELGLDRVDHLAPHLVGLIGWIQSNKRWDILTSMWEEIAHEIKKKTGKDWDLLAAGTWRDPAHLPDYEKYMAELEVLEKKGLAHYYEFVPRGEQYYKAMAVCDFIVLPSLDETQSGTLARIIALNKPFVTTAPMEGLTTQTLESEGGVLFTDRDMLRKKVLRLACDEGLRMELGNNLRRYLEKVVSWEVIARQYDKAYALARSAKRTGRSAELPPEF